MSDEKTHKSVYRDADWRIIEERLNSDKPQERYIESEVLARLIESYAGEPLPEGLTRYICQIIRGEIKRPKGRPTHEHAEKRDTLIPILYDTFSELLAKRDEDPTLDGSAHLLTADAYDRAPHEQAAYMVAEFINGIRGFPPCSAKHVLNLVSAARQKAK